MHTALPLTFPVPKKMNQRQLQRQAEQERLSRELMAIKIEDDHMRAIIESELLAIRLKKEEEAVCALCKVIKPND